MEMTENKRFKYVRDTYRHYVHDTEKDGEWKEGYRGTYGEFDLDKLTIELNKRENRINHLKNENEQLKQTIDDLTSEFEGYHKSLEETKDYDKQFEVTTCPYEIRNNKTNNYYWLEHEGNVTGICKVLNEQSEKINELEKQIADDFNQSNCITVQKSVIADLRERNNRQAEQLDILYCLIEAKDWSALTDTLDDFKECEEQLQSEWKCY